MDVRMSTISRTDREENSRCLAERLVEFGAGV